MRRQVITIEKLTSFHNFNPDNNCCIYPGGFHNQIKRKFIMKLDEQNHDIMYYHFGDIDAGGYYIYEPLVEKTGLNIQTMNMNPITLEKNKDLWKELTLNDKKRLRKLKEHLHEKESRGVLLKGYRDTLDYMLENNCKLEQEAVYANDVI